MSIYDISSLVSNWNYSRTTEFNGKTGRKGRQMVKVVDAALVPAEWNGDKKIAAKAIVEGKRGAQYSALVYRNGFVSVL